MNSANMQSLCDEIVAILRRQCEAERVRRLRAGDALALLRASVARDVWDAFSMAAHGASAERIGVLLELPASGVDALLRRAWSALRGLQLGGDGELRASASAVLQSCARAAEFHRVVDPVELRWASELGLRLSLEEVARRGVAEAASKAGGAVAVDDVPSAGARAATSDGRSDGATRACRVCRGGPAGIDSRSVVQSARTGRRSAGRS